MAITPTYANVEMADGTQHSVRILLADQVRMEGTAKRNKWDMEADQITVNTFVTFAAMKRSGLYTDTYDKFVGGDCVDLYISKGTPETDEDDEDRLNPTEPATQND